MICSRVAAEKLRGDGGGGDADEQHVIKADAVETVFERENALDFVRLDHRGEDIADGESLFAFGTLAAAEVIGDAKDRAEIVGGMAPFGGKPGVVEIQPADDATDVECGGDGIEFVTGAGNAAPFGTVMPGTTGPRSLVQAG